MVVLKLNVQLFGGRGGGSGMGKDQNFEWTDDNSGGFSVNSKAKDNMQWYDNLYESNGFYGKDVQAIVKYQNSSQATNEQLREDSLKPSTRTKVNALTRILDDAEVETPFVAHRSSDGKLLGIDGDVTVEAIRSRIGKTVTDKGFTSASLDDNSLYDKGTIQYITKTGGIKKSALVHYHIKTPAGKGIGGLVLGPKWAAGTSEAHYAQMPEFIFSRSSQYRVVGAYNSGGKVHCNLEYVGNARR